MYTAVYIYIHNHHHQLGTPESMEFMCHKSRFDTDHINIYEYKDILVHQNLSSTQWKIYTLMMVQ